jgi:type VI secretion system FHA domain protein
VLGVYEIEVRLVEDVQQSWSRPAAAPAAQSDPFGNPFDDDPFFPSAFPQSPVTAPVAGLAPFSPTLPTTFDPLLPDEDAFPGSTRDDHSSAISDAINLPPARSVLPDDWDDDFRSQPAASPNPRADADRPEAAVVRPPVASPHPGEAPVFQEAVHSPVGRVAEAAMSEAAMSGAVVPKAEVPGAGGDLLAAFLRGAGLENLALPNPVETMEQLGAAFRAMVSGIRHTLIARSEVKREFRIEATVIRRRGNNVLKFSADDDDALTGLLGAGRRTDMGAEEAITDALRDIRLHELATMTAMQVAVRALVERLGPDQIREAKDQTGGLAMFGARKARAWDAYEALHAEVLRGLSDDFDSLFGKRFALAYEQAVHELMSKQTNLDDGR